MTPRRVGRPLAAIAAVIALAGALAVLARRRPPAPGDAWRRLRTSSSPSARLYEALAGRLLAGLYERMAVEALAALPDGGAERPDATGADALEIGPGPGHLAVRLATRVPGLRILGVDIDPAMIELASARAASAGVADRVRFVVGDAARLPLPDGSIDLALTSFSVHHWPDPRTGFAEIRRVLRPGGRLLAYDLPDRWSELEMGAPGLAPSAVSGGFARARVSRLRWPGPLRLVQRLEAERADGPASTG